MTTTKKTEVKAEKVAARSVANASQEGVLLQEKNGISYYKLMITCACGAEFEAGSTKSLLRVDICSACHPMFTGEQKILDIEGRVDKFKKKYNLK